eukprot:365123-Chlamydomonas_euryale.AAC.20
MLSYARYRGRPGAAHSAARGPPGQSWPLLPMRRQRRWHAPLWQRLHRHAAALPAVARGSGGLCWQPLQPQAAAPAGPCAHSAQRPDRAHRGAQARPPMTHPWAVAPPPPTPRGIPAQAPHLRVVCLPLPPASAHGRADWTATAACALCPFRPDCRAAAPPVVWLHTRRLAS